VSDYVEVTVRVGDEVVDVHQFGPGEELEREAYETGVGVVARNVLPAIVGTVTQYHDHDTEQEACTCESRYAPSWWTNGLSQRDGGDLDDFIAELGLTDEVAALDDEERDGGVVTFAPGEVTLDVATGKFTRRIAGGEDTLAELQAIIDARKQH
jgi:hypothetical protein